jgi:hypothetical protein
MAGQTRQVGIPGLVVTDGGRRAPGPPGTDWHGVEWVVLRVFLYLGFLINAAVVAFQSQAKPTPGGDLAANMAWLAACVTLAGLAASSRGR